MREYVAHIEQYKGGFGPGENLILEDGYIVRIAPGYRERMTLPQLIAAVKEQREFRKTHKPPKR